MIPGDAFVTKIKCYQHLLKEIESGSGSQRFVVFCSYRNNEHLCGSKEVSIGNDGCKAFSPALADLETVGRGSKGTR